MLEAEFGEIDHTIGFRRVDLRGVATTSATGFRSGKTAAAAATGGRILASSVSQLFDVQFMTQDHILTRIDMLNAMAISV